MINIDRIYLELEKHFHSVATPVVELIEAQTKDPFKILITTILSARTKDGTTAAVVSKLFAVVDNYQDLRKFSVEELEELIYPIGFFRNKAKFLAKMPDALEKKFQGIVPQTIDELCELPGVGRKTANLVRAIAFHKPAICVDIHVHRISNRLGYVNTKTPFETEMILRKKLPNKYWINYNSYLVAFGQNHCTPRNPKCDSCPIFMHCKRVEVVSKYL